MAGYIHPGPSTGGGTLSQEFISVVTTDGIHDSWAVTCSSVSMVFLAGVPLPPSQWSFSGGRITLSEVPQSGLPLEALINM
jgi:hypothetical protein